MPNTPVPSTPDRVNIEDLDGGDILVTKRGFKLKIIPIPTDLMIKARQRVPIPEPPEVPDTEKPGQVFLNTLDPNYQKAMDRYNVIINELSIKIMAAYGIKAYAVPPGFYAPEDDQWAEQLQDDEIFGVDGESYTVDVPPKDQPKARFFAWLRYHVLSEDDAQPFYDAIMHGVGIVLEKDVEEAADSFRGDEGRISPNGRSRAPEREKSPT